MDFSEILMLLKLASHGVYSVNEDNLQVNVHSTFLNGDQSTTRVYSILNSPSLEIYLAVILGILVWQLFKTSLHYRWIILFLSWLKRSHGFYRIFIIFVQCNLLFMFFSSFYQKAFNNNLLRILLKFLYFFFFLHSFIYVSRSVAAFMIVIFAESLFVHCTLGNLLGPGRHLFENHV